MFEAIRIFPGSDLLNGPSYRSTDLTGQKEHSYRGEGHAEPTTPSTISLSRFISKGRPDVHMCATFRVPEITASKTSAMVVPFTLGVSPQYIAGKVYEGLLFTTRFRSLRSWESMRVSIDMV